MKSKASKSYWFAFYAVILIAGAIILNLVFEDVTYITQIAVPILSTFGSFLGITAVTQLFVIKEVLDDFFIENIAINNIRESGLNGVYKDFSTDVKWSDFFHSVKKTLDMTINYGSTWRDYYKTSLEEILKKKIIVNVYLPDYEDNQIMQSLDKRYYYGDFAEEDKYKKGSVDRIKDAAAFFSGLNNKKKKGKVNVFLFRGTFQHSYFIADGKIVIYGPQKHGKDKAGVPAWTIHNGWLIDTINEDMKRISSESRQI